MRYEQIKDFIEAAGLCQTHELVEAGIHYRQIKRALDEGIVQPVCVSVHGEIPGWYASPEVAEDHTGHLREVVACRMTGGVVALDHAASLHGLIPGNRSRLTLIVPHGCSRTSPAMDFVRMRTRNPAYLGEGVVEGYADGGLAFSITSKARTVIDLMRLEDKGWGRQATEAMRTFFEEGGEPAEIDSVMRRLGFGPEDALMKRFHELARYGDEGGYSR